MSLFLESFLWRVQLEWPEEVVDFLEVGADIGNFVDDIFNANNTKLAELLFNNAVVSKWDSRPVDLTVTPLVDHLGNHGPVKVTVGNKRLDSADHVHGGLVQLDENSVVKLSQSEQLSNFLAFRVELVDTKNVNIK